MRVQCGEGEDTANAVLVATSCVMDFTASGSSAFRLLT